MQHQTVKQKGEKENRKKSGQSMKKMTTILASQQIKQKAK